MSVPGGPGLWDVLPVPRSLARELTRLLFLMASVSVSGSNAAKAQLIAQMKASAKWLVENVELIG